MNPLADRWNANTDWFRDTNQRVSVGNALVHRLADDRNQEECRYLMRLSWHLHMTYQEVAYEELLDNVGPRKMDRLHELFQLIASRDYAGIDAWVADCLKLPIIVDNWLENNRDTAYVQELLDNSNAESTDSG